MPASLDTTNLCIAIVNHACACSKLAERCCLQIERARHIGFTPTHLQQSTSILVMPISCGSIKHTIQIKSVGCRVPGGPRLDDLFVTTVKTFWQVWLNPLYTQFALDFAAHASMSHGACLHLKQCYASLCAYLFFPKKSFCSDIASCAVPSLWYDDACCTRTYRPCMTRCMTATGSRSHSSSWCLHPQGRYRRKGIPGSVPA